MTASNAIDDHGRAMGGAYAAVAAWPTSCALSGEPASVNATMPTTMMRTERRRPGAAESRLDDDAIGSVVAKRSAAAGG